MKKIAIPVVCLVLLLAVVWQYRKLSRLSPPEDYEYQFRDDIDMGYHTPRLVRDYFDTGYMVGSFAREMWKNRGLNVRFPESDDLSNAIAVSRYNHLRATADSMGLRLANSLQLKQMGLNNADIQSLELSGDAPTRILVRKQFQAEVLRLGDRTQGVWKLQGILISKGYTMPHDGYFWTETELAIKDFQQKKQLFPNGIADYETLALLAGQKK